MKRIIALFSAVVIMTSTFLCPIAKANVVVDYTNATLAQFLLEQSLIGAGTIAGSFLAANPAAGALIGECVAKGINDLAKYYAAGYTDQDFYDAYNQDVSGIQSDLGTVTITNSGLRLYFSVSGLKFSSNAVDDGSSGSFVSIHSSDLQSAYCQVNFHSLHAPCGGTYLPGYFVSGSGCAIRFTVS